MTRRLATFVLLAAGALPLGGCSIQLFSHDRTDGADPDRLDLLERRMEAVEKAIGTR